MIHTDYEREHLSDKIFMIERQAQIEKEWYLWEQKNKQNDDNKAKITIGQRVRYESLHSDELDKEQSEPARISGKYEISSLDTYSREKELPF